MITTTRVKESRSQEVPKVAKRAKGAEHTTCLRRDSKSLKENEGEVGAVMAAVVEERVGEGSTLENCMGRGG